MRAQIFLNKTTIAEAAASGDTKAAELIAADYGYAEAPAIFSRFPKDNKAPIEPGDRLVRVGSLDFPAATTVEQVCNAAFAAGNSPYESDTGVTEYRSWQVRSLSVGDVVLVSVGDTKVAFAVAGCGFTQIDETLAAYKVAGEVKP